MKTFHCAGCGLRIFFENDHCVQCGRRLGFLSDSLTIEALDEHSGNQWSRLPAAGNPQRYRKCENENQHQICNWMVPVEDENPFCLACRLNEIIPNLSAAGNLERWRKLEAAKKRCLYSSLGLGLPIAGVLGENRPALHFRFLADIPANATIVTGHQAGTITVNIAEADDDEREHRRLHLHEPYRTLVGHLRHELGHYYWDRLIAGSPQLSRFRELFGDETTDYQSALQNYYRAGPAADWSQRCVTAYASAHPWEDWAETWAHYLHIHDTMQTADHFELTVGPGAQAVPGDLVDFDKMFARWIPLSGALNAINRGMGLPDLYPFVVPDAAVHKLRFIHELIATRNRMKPVNAVPTEPPPVAISTRAPNPDKQFVAA